MAVTEGLEYMPLDGRLGSAAMEGSSDRGVTPQGVREGDRAALQALVDRRGPAVVAFCAQVCGPQNADRAAAEAFARFRAAVGAAPDLTDLDPEALLRGATRHAAASMARQPSGPPPHGRLRSRGTQTCEHVPTMLAARANGALGDADLERLARHLERCERCDALGEIFRRAELSYQDPAVDTLGTETSSVLLEALEAVPHHGHAVAPAPAGDAPVGDALTGAFPTLPDLDDEVPIEVAQVASPATDLDAEDLAAEPLPESEPDVLAPGDEDLGLTVEWDNELVAGPVAEPVVVDPEDAAAAPLLTGGTKSRRSGPRPLAILLPLLLVIVLAVGAAVAAGVFSGDDASPTVDKAPAPRVQAPVTTPLPIKVKKKTAASTASTETPAASSPSAASDGTASTSATDATGTTP